MNASILHSVLQKDSPGNVGSWPTCHKSTPAATGLTIPKGLHHSAQGCRACEATLGERSKIFPTLKGLHPAPSDSSPLQWLTGFRVFESSVAKTFGKTVGFVIMFAGFAWLSFFTGRARAQAPAFEWAVRAGGTNGEYASGVAVDGMANVYVTGAYFTRASFGKTNLVSPSTNSSEQTFFLAKYDRAGSLIWARNIFPCCGSYSVQSTVITADSAGRIGIRGTFRGAVQIDGFSLRSDDNIRSFVVRFGSDGQVVWAEQGGQRLGDTYDTWIRSDCQDNLYIVGTIGSTAAFGNITLDPPGPGIPTIYIVKYGSFGNVIWGRTIHPNGTNYGDGSVTALASDCQGNSYVSGLLSGQLDFDGTILSSTNRGNAVFLSKFDPSGNVVWARAFSNSANSYITRIVVAPGGQVGVAGVLNCFGAIKIDGFALLNDSCCGQRPFITMFSDTGAPLWADQGRSSCAYLSGATLAVDGFGSLYLGGSFSSSSLSFGSEVLLSMGDYLPYVVKYDLTGRVVWAKRGTVPPTFEYDLVADQEGNNYLVGTFPNGAAFDSTNLNSVGNSDVFVAKLSAGAPIITSQPQNQTVAIGDTAIFTVSAINNPPFTYQWQFFGTNLLGETNSTLTITNVQPENAGVYRVMVSNNVGAVFSELATLILIAPLAITTQPQSQTVVAGTNVTFSVAASGTAPFSYHWLFNGTNLPGAPNMTLVISNAQPNKAGTYSVVVTNVQGAVTSSVAILSVRYLLMVNSNGNGTVTRNPNFPIYPPNLSVTLTATPAAGSVFRNWSGDANGSTNPLTVVMTTNKTITANFVSTALAISIVGQGTVTVSPDQPVYNVGDSVTLTATAGRWYAFSRWGDGPTDNPRMITIGTNNHYSAIFSPTTAVETLMFNNVSRTAPAGMPAILVDGEFVVTGAVTRFGSAQIEMLTTFPNGAILYTSDGSPPSLNSMLYIDAFTLQRSATIRAAAWDANFANSWEADPVQVIIEPLYSLNVTTWGGGGVSVSPTNAGYLSNTVVMLVAAPDPGWTLLQWLGDASGANPTNNVVMTRNKCVEAVFGTSLSTVASGGGSVSVQPNATLYPYGTVVRLTAIPQAGNAFALWGNAGSGTNNPLLYTVTSSNRTVSAAFTSLSAGESALAVVADGFGSVTNKPRGNRFANSTTVTLTALPDVDQQFLGWSGDASGVQNPLTVVLNNSKVITAQFTKRPRLSFPPCIDGSSGEPLAVWLTGDWGAIFGIESATKVIGPWSPYITLTNQFGRTQFLVPGATNGLLQFYRAIAK